MIDNQNFQPVKKGLKRVRGGFKSPKSQKRTFSTTENRSKIKRNFKALLRRRAQKPPKTEYRSLKHTPIVPKSSMHGFALMIVIAIMSFLAAWTVFGAHLVSQSAQNWSGAIAREAVVQIMPVPEQNAEEALTKAAEIIRAFPGVANTHIITTSETQNLLAPWLGSEADISSLPVPRLITVSIDKNNPPDFTKLTQSLKQNIKGVRFDKQQVWAERLVKGAHLILIAAFLILALVLVAMALTIIFASRAALAGNMHIIEVLHLIGADDRFVSKQFDNYFFRTGLKGGLLGVLAAGGLFIISFTWINFHWSMAEGRQLSALFGHLQFNWALIVEMIILILAVAFIAMFASHYSVVGRLRQIDRQSSSFFSEIN